MIHVLVLSVKVRRNYVRLWQSLDTGNVFRQRLASKIYNNLNLRNKTTIKIYNSPYFHQPTWDKFALPYTSPNLVQELFNNWL